MRSLPTSLPRSVTGFAAAALLLLTLAGCSAPADSRGASSDGDGGTASSEAEFSAARDAYDLKLAECLRGKGFDIKDPEPGMGVQESSEEINAAGSICMTEIGDPPVYESPMSDAEVLTMQLAWAECFRELGYQVDEPQSGQAFVIPENASNDDIAACTGSGL